VWEKQAKVRGKQAKVRGKQAEVWLCQTKVPETLKLKLNTSCKTRQNVVKWKQNVRFILYVETE